MEIKDNIEKLNKSMDKHCIQCKEYLQKENEEFLNAEKLTHEWKESASSILRDGKNLIDTFSAKDLKHNIPTGKFFVIYNSIA